MKRVAILSMAVSASSVAFISPSRAGEGAAISSTAQELSANIRNCLASMAAEDRFSGVFYVEKDGQPLLEFSRAALGSGPFTIDTPFNIASAAKMFTAVAIGQLVDQGTLRFDAPLGVFLKELPPELAAVRIDQALTHTGGIRGMTQLTPDLSARIRASKSARDLVPLIAREGLLFEPGSKTQYSNGGFVLLGAVVEAASGVNFQDYVARNILAKAGMTSSGPVERPTAAVRLSRMAPGAPPKGRARTRMGSASPAGGWYSSARDMARFARALRQNQLLSPATTKSLLSIRSTVGRSAESGSARLRTGYGFGFGITETGSDKIVGHNGGAPGSNAEVWTSVNNGWTAVALSNIDPPAATNAMNYARQVLISGAGTMADCQRLAAMPGPFDGPVVVPPPALSSLPGSSPGIRLRQP